MEALVPTPRKAATLAPPKKGQRGILLSAGLLQLDGTAEGTVEASCEGTASKPHGMAHVLPRLGLNSPPSTLMSCNLGDAMTLSLKTPQSARLQAQRERAWQETRDIVEARHALRSAVPGEWDAALFCKLRKQFMAEGRWHAVTSLHDMAAKASRTVFDCGSYASPEPHQPAIRLPRRAWAKWVSLSNLTAQERHESTQPPPLVCSPLGPLEVAKSLAKMFPRHPVTMSFEATDFDEESGLLLGAMEARSVAQKEMLLRTTLEFNSRTGAALCRTGTTPRGHLTARTDAQIMAAEEVLVFRGPAEQGYPFLAEKEHTVVRVLVLGRTSPRPLMMGGKKGEVFAEKADFSGHMDRLHLLALAALPDAKDSGSNAEGVGAATCDRFCKQSEGPLRPVLVIAAHDLTVAAAQQPRHSIAAALQTWRRLYADLFQAVVVACGDSATATMLDQAINLDIYVNAISGQGAPPAWHWHVPLLDLSVNPVLSRIGSRARPPEPRSPASTAAGGDTTRSRRPSVLQLCLLAETTLHRAQTDNASSSARRPSRVDAGPVAQALAAEQQRRGSVSMQTDLPARRPSIAECQDSRSAYELAVATRLANANSHEPNPEQRKSVCPVNGPAEVEARPGMRRLGAVKRGAKEPADAAVSSHETMTLEKLRMLEQNASSLAMPDEVKLHVVKMVQASWADASEVRDEAERLFGEVRDLAGSLEPRLKQLREMAKVKGPAPGELVGAEASTTPRSLAGAAVPLERLSKIGVPQLQPRRPRPGAR